MDDFEGYPSVYTGIPSPWEDSANQCAFKALGIGESMGSCGPGYNWDWGSAFRRITGGSVLVAKLRLDTSNTYQGVKIGIVRDKTVYDSNKSFMGNDNAVLDIFGDDKGKVSLMFVVEDYKEGKYGADTRIEVPGLSVGTWYDIKMTVAGRDVTAEYKRYDSKVWIKIGELTAYSGFLPNYVAISAIRGGCLDDVGYGSTAFFEDYLRTRKSQ